jgi:hypothetical protein
MYRYNLSRDDTVYYEYAVDVGGNGDSLPYLVGKDTCIELLGGTQVSIIFTADPGVQHGGIGENYYILESLQKPKNVTFPACFSAVQGELFSSKVVLVTTGEGPSTAQLCVFQVLGCSPYIKETMFFGTAGFSPRKGGILNPPSTCTPPEGQGTLVRYGDICVTNHAINWDCQGAEWSSTAASWPNECSLAGDPAAPFQAALQDASSASYRGWDCIVTDPDEASKQLADDLYAAQNYTNRVAPPPDGVQEYLEWFWGNTTEGINRTWEIDTAAAPRVFQRTECAEVDTVYWWTGTPWDTQSRGFASYAVGGTPTSTETIVASAMEGIGYMTALRLAENTTGIPVPHAVIRATSDFTVPIPVYQAANGTWLPGDSISLPPSLTDAGGAPVTIYAIQSGNALILGLFENRFWNSSTAGSQSIDSVSISSSAVPVLTVKHLACFLMIAFVSFY